jgi:NAD+ synthase
MVDRFKGLDIDPPIEVERIIGFMRTVISRYHKEGFIVGLSGGIDSALAVSLCVKAIGRNRVVGVILPEKDSNPMSRELAEEHGRQLGIECIIEDITPVLSTFGTYERRDQVIKRIYPDYTPDHKIKLFLPQDVINNDLLNFFSLEVIKDKNVVFSKRLNKKEIMGIMAATDTKQRTRMMHLYYHAESRNYLVCGTTNRTELLQGYYVKYGDGGVDLEPLAHLYKAQVYDLSRHLGVTQGIIDRPPSPDTFNSYISDEEFYLRMPYKVLDTLLYAWENEVGIEEVSEVLGLTTDQVGRALNEIKRKFNSTTHLRELPPNLFVRGE